MTQTGLRKRRIQTNQVDVATEEVQLNGYGPTEWTIPVTFAKVRVAGSNPVVRSKFPQVTDLT